MSGMNERMSLADAIAGLRNQLRQAQRSAEHLAERDRFSISEVEIELTVSADEGTEVSGETGWWVFKAGAKIADKDTVTHKVRLRLAIGDVSVSSEDKTR